MLSCFYTVKQDDKGLCDISKNSKSKIKTIPSPK